MLEKLMQYTNCPEDAATIMQRAARQATAQGHWEDAIDLYMTSRQFSKAVDTLTEQLEQNYRDWHKGSRNQILIDKARRVLEDEGLCQGPASTSMYPVAAGAMGVSYDIGEQRAMQESVRSLKKLYIVAHFFDNFEKGEEARSEFERLEAELRLTNQMHLVTADQYSRPGHPLRQKREQIQMFYNNALAVLAEQGPHNLRLLPVFLNAPGQFMNVPGSEFTSTPAIRKLVEECGEEYNAEIRVGVKAAVREMLGPVCDIQGWLYHDEEHNGHPSTKATHKEVFKMTNGALKQFATIPEIRNGLKRGVPDKIRDLRDR